MEKFDFSGWATRNDLLCSDGRTIRKDAFKHNDGQTVPLVWQHNHADPENVLGHALLENRDEGVYAYCSFNNSDAGKHGKELVVHGDVRSLSIYANKLKQSAGDVLHGSIKEVSLVLSGANPGAFIDSVMVHGEESEDSIILGYDENIMLYHSEEPTKEIGVEEKEEVIKHEEPAKEESKDKTVGEVLETLNKEQATVVYGLIGKALDKSPDKEDEENGGNEEMKHNVFENEPENTNVLSHDDMKTIIGDAKRYGSLRDSVLAHADDYGIEDVEWLFPDAKNLNTPPEFIKRDTSWVQKVMTGTKHSPFSRIKSMFADIREDEARAKGYIKGNLKKEEVFSLLKRTTTPTTIYKKQKMDRDDIIDITDFDVISWLKGEMRMMLDEEIARAILIGDGRLASSDDKINEGNIRPIWKDSSLYSIKKKISFGAADTDDQKAKKFIRAAVKARKDYKGSGQPTMFTTEDVITDCLLMEDSQGRVIYDTIEKLATALRVKEIVPVEVMENLTRTGVQSEDGDTDTRSLMAIIVNLSDYNVGADKGGAINMFEDFDIDYNQEKYLIETRCSGALIKPYSAIVLESVTAAS